MIRWWVGLALLFFAVALASPAAACSTCNCSMPGLEPGTYRPERNLGVVGSSGECRILCSDSIILCTAPGECESKSVFGRVRLGDTNSKSCERSRDDGPIGCCPLHGPHRNCGGPCTPIEELDLWLKELFNRPRDAAALTIRPLEAPVLSQPPKQGASAAAGSVATFAQT